MLAASRPRLAAAAAAASPPSPAALAASATSTTSSHNLTSRLIASALPHIPIHGFTPFAVLAGARASDLQLKAPLDAPTIQRLFPGGHASQTAIPLRLLKRWDVVQLKAMRHQFEAIKGSTSQPGGGGAGLQPGQGSKGTFGDALALLEARLAESDRVKVHLLEAFSYMSANPLPSPILSILPRLLPFPLALVLPHSIPNPLPLVARAGQIAEESCTIANHDGGFGPRWYTSRTRLAMAYLLSELHLLAKHSLPASTSLLRALSSSEGPSIMSDLQAGTLSAKQWIEWGGRGWIGILRSQGLG